MAAVRSAMEAATYTSSMGQRSHDKKQYVIELYLEFWASAPTPVATGEFLLLLLSICHFLFLIIFSSFVAAVDERCGHKLGAPSPRTTSSPLGPVATMNVEDDDAEKKQPPWLKLTFLILNW